MRSALVVGVTALFLVIVAGCAPPPPASSDHPHPIIVRQFTAPPGVVTLDPSLGFSLHRGRPGVPRRERAATVARAVAFNLSDAIATRLGALGYDAIRSDTAGAEPGEGALIVSGRFDRINEGRRRRNESVGVGVEVSYQPSAGVPPRRLTAFHLDSRRMRHDPLIMAAQRGGVAATATAMGHVIANYTSDLARLNKWPSAAP